MFKRLHFITSILIVSLTIPGCSTLPLPNFNGGALNPDIRFLRAGEVMNGVKCAMTEFMREREIRILEDRWNKAARRYDTDEDRLAFVALYASEYPKLYRSFSTGLTRDPSKTEADNVKGTDNPFSPYALGVDKVAGAVAGEKACNFYPKTADGRFIPKKLDTPLSAEDFYHWEASPDPIVCKEEGNCRKNTHCVRNAYYCPGELGIAIWDYGARDIYERMSDKKQPIPLKRGIGNCAAIPDYSRFALDKTQQSTITLQLTGTNTGIAFYDTINAAGLGPLENIIAAGNRSIGAVFPKADFTGKGTTNFEMAVQMPQTIFTPGLIVRNEEETPKKPAYKGGTAPIDADQARAAQTRLQELGYGVSADGAYGEGTERAIREFQKDRSLNATGQLDSDTLNTLFAREGGGRAPTNPDLDDGDATIKPGKDYLTSKEVRLIKSNPPTKKFTYGCGGDGSLHLDQQTDIDYLALKDMLLKVVFDQNDQVRYQGGPEVSLDQLTLTTSFQIILDVSAGTKHIFRLFPMVTAPQMGVRAEHVHQLKIVLKGQKRKGDVNEALRVEQSCLELVTNRKSGMPPKGIDDPVKFCKSPTGKLLTKISDSLENNKGSSAGTSAGGQ